MLFNLNSKYPVEEESEKTHAPREKGNSADSASRRWCWICSRAHSPKLNYTDRGHLIGNAIGTWGCQRDFQTWFPWCVTFPKAAGIILTGYVVRSRNGEWKGKTSKLPVLPTGKTIWSNWDRTTHDRILGAEWTETLCVFDGGSEIVFVTQEIHSSGLSSLWSL